MLAPTHHRRTPLLALAALTLTAPLLLGPSAHAKGDGVVRSGSCSSGAAWKLKAKPDNGRIEVEAEVDSNRVGQTWRWRLRHNGSLSARGTATTSGPSGSFSVTRRMANLAGTDTIRLRATRPATGEVCVGTVRL
jgi:hypothetical protein